SSEEDAGFACRRVFSTTESAEGTESCRRGECAALALPQPSNLQIALFVCDPDSKTGVPERTKAAAMKHDRRPEQNRDRKLPSCGTRPAVPRAPIPVPRTAP